MEQNCDHRSFLRDHGDSICFLLALVLAFFFSWHVIGASVDPKVDGLGYTLRGFALYGYLHTGQWTPFWKLLNSPCQSVCPLHYLPFFLLPQGLAGVGSYILFLNLTTYLLLAYAIVKLCQVVQRPEWAPAIFLLCSVNNLALDDTYAFYLDMEFIALGMLVIAWQMEAWRGERVSRSVLASVGLGLLFAMKPANALIFLALFVLSEIGFAVGNRYFFPSILDRRQGPKALRRHWGWFTLGLVPCLGLVLSCGGAQSILFIIQNNEVATDVVPLSCTGLVRFLYFPLCLSFYYHVLALVGLLLVAYFVRWKSIDRDGLARFPAGLFVPVALAYLVFGEFFSFGMLVKTMRSLLPMLPLLWLGFFWWGERRRLSAGLMTLVAVGYTSLAFAQLILSPYQRLDILAADFYQLSRESWTQGPVFWDNGTTGRRFVQDKVCDLFREDPPPPGIICVISQPLQVQLIWRLTADDLLHGQAPRYQIRRMFNPTGAYYNQSLVGADLIFLFTYHLKITTEGCWPQTMALLDYGKSEWCDKEGLARLRVAPPLMGEPLGYGLYFSHPLTEAQVDQLIQSAAFGPIAKVDGNGSAPIEGIHFSTVEARHLLEAWWQKRMGK